MLLKGGSLSCLLKQQLFGFGGGAGVCLHVHIFLQRPVRGGTLVENVINVQTCLQRRLATKCEYQVKAVSRKCVTKSETHQQRLLARKCVIKSDLSATAFSQEMCHQVGPVSKGIYAGNVSPSQIPVSKGI